MTKKQKKELWRIVIGVALFILVMILHVPSFVPESYQYWWTLLLYIIPYLVIGGEVLLKAVRNILNGQVFDENFLMCVATIGAFILGENKEAVSVMIFYQIGELFQDYAVNRSRRSISQLMDIRPEYANVWEDGVLTQKDPDEVEIGETIVIKAGERVPLDGVVLSGESMVDTSALTGEAVPRTVRPGSEIISGCINKNGTLQVQVTKEFDDSTVARILEMVENAGNKKAKAEHFITKFARYYTPAVVIGAVLLALIPPLVLGGGFAQWVERALIFLVISCPCALVISIPLSFFGGIGGASRQGILVKGGNYLEALAELDTVVFDKTGTLTKGTFRVTSVKPVGMEKEELLRLAAFAECYSDHPISLSLKEAWGGEIPEGEVTDVKEISGHGIRAKIEGRVVLAGNKKLMDRENISIIQEDENGKQEETAGTVVYVAYDGKFAGTILISDELKEGAAEAIRALKEAGVKKTVMLTGDRKAAAEAVYRQLGLDSFYGELLPGDKVTIVEELLSEKAPNRKLAFVGDGINDAPVLTRADVGIAMGAMGSDAAIEAADVVLMDDSLDKIALAVKIARKTLRIVRQNIVFALGVKLLVLLLGALGLANMWMAVFADVGVSVIAILNAMRALRKIG